jgi:hypothetical protein
VVVLQALAGDERVKFGLHGGSSFAVLALGATVEVSALPTLVSAVTRVRYN